LPVPPGYYELGYLTSEVRVVIKKEVSRLSVASLSYEDLKPEAVLVLPRWAAEKLVASKIAEYQDRGIDRAVLAQLAWRERRSVSELAELPQGFYREASSLLRRLRETSPEQARETEARLRDIISVRCSKILSFAARGVQVERIRNLAPEEAALYADVRKELDGWVTALLARDEGA